MWSSAILIVLMVICVITDIKNRKIYNKVLFPVLLMALLFHLMSAGFHGLFHALGGFTVGLAILLIPYLLGGMGAGDVKLLAVIGSLKGSAFVLYTALYMALVGGLIALIILLFRKGTLKHIIYFLTLRRYGVKMPLFLHRDSISSTYPYGVAIAAGVFINLIWKGGLFL